MIRSLDLLGSLVGLVLAAPFLLVASIATLLDSGSPILYKSVRVGKGGDEFELLKLRTMRIDSDEGPLITSTGDPRVTAVGRILRRTKLDELPQLINVVKGEMSLVGPRPEVRKYVEQFPEEFSAILTVRPGITGRASIEYRNESDLLAASPDPERAYVDVILPDKLALEREYVLNRSVPTNLRLLFATVKVLAGSDRAKSQ